MQQTDRFLGFADQQLSELCRTSPLRQLALYLSRSIEAQGPSLELVSQWPKGDRQLPPADKDPDLRRPVDERRWYPLQDGTVILGALRAELDPSQDWSQDLDQRLRSCADAVSHALNLDLECLRLRQELLEQREHTRTLVHQLRNPLAALRTYAKLLLRRMEPDNEHRDLVEGMLSEQTQLNRYVNVLESLGRDVLPKAADSTSPLLLPPVPSPERLPLSEHLKPLLERAEATASLQDRHWSGPEHWPQWTLALNATAATAILEIVANLIENAFRYSPAGCRIGLLVLQDGLCVWDEGPAIAPAEHDRIFQRGVRGAASRELSGSGLGLALARDLAERHGGSLDLEIHPAAISPSLPDSGNAFRLRWPA